MNDLDFETLDKDMLVRFGLILVGNLQLLFHFLLCVWVSRVIPAWTLKPGHASKTIEIVHDEIQSLKDLTVVGIMLCVAVAVIALPSNLSKMHRAYSVRPLRTLFGCITGRNTKESGNEEAGEKTKGLQDN